MIINSIGYNSLSNLSINNNKNKKADMSLDNLSTNSQNLGKSLNSIAFQGGSLVGLRKVKIQNVDTKVVFDKVAQVLKKLPPSAKMAAPILLTVGDEKYGFTWDKSMSKKYKLVIKNNINSKEDWTKADASRSVMSCVFDENGMMQVGELTKPINSEFSQGVFFHHEGKYGRRIRLNDLTLRPTSTHNNLWSIITELSTRNTNGQIDLSTVLKDTMLSDMFLELAKNKTTILL